MRRFRYLLFIFCVYTFYGFSQDRHLDSLIASYTRAESDTDRINKYSDIGSYISSKGNYPQAINYYQKIIRAFSKTYPQKCIDAKNKIAFNYISMEEYDKADSITTVTLEDSKKINYLKGIGMANRNLGLINIYQGDYKKAVDYHLSALKIGESIKSIQLINISNSDLGIAFYYQEDYEKAAYYWENAIKIAPDKTSNDYLSDCSNLAQAYIELEKFDNATNYCKKVLDFYSANKKSANYINALGGLANIEYKRKNYGQALIYYSEIINLREQYHSRDNDLAITYLNTALVYGELGKSKEAIEYGLKGYQKAVESGDKNELLHAYNNLNTIYAKIGNFEKAYELAQLYTNLRDSLSNTESKKQINELDKKYQTEKKEKENQLLNKQLEIQQIQGKQQQFFLIISIGIVILIGVLSVILYRQNKQKQKVNFKLAEKNKIIEEQHKDITDSIKYAQRIQQAIFPPYKMWYELLPHSFVLFKPKDVLSGDFYWIEQNKEYIYVAAADCTGHGVPGALMSIVNYNLLNKAVLEQNMTKPAEILDAVNKWLTVSLHQTYNESTVKDGMDIALCALHKKNNLLEFAGAFNGGYIFKKDNSIIELNGNKTPVGAFMEEKITSFTNHTLALEKGDKIYIFSDGYADQFGGPKGKKLKYKKLQEYIKESLDLSMPEQKKHLEKKFTEWKGNLEQIDDVLIIGITV
jgi:serine phosphatase RsbU (regulator of sigma subunit)